MFSPTFPYLDVVCEQGAVDRVQWDGTRFSRSIHGLQSLVQSLQIIIIGSCLQLYRLGFPPFNQSINGGDGCRHQSASMSISYFLYSTHIQINLITTYILRPVSSSGKISCVIKNNILVNPVLV